MEKKDIKYGEMGDVFFLFFFFIRDINRILDRYDLLQNFSFV